jgi:putative lipoprotein
MVVRGMEVRAAAAALLLAAVVAGCAAPPAAAPAESRTATLSGTVTWRARVALAPGAVMKVWLQDLSSTVAPVDYLAETEVPAPVGPPVPFALRYDPARVVAGHRLVLLVKIFEGDRIRFTNAARYPVITEGCREACEVVVDLMN